MLIRGGTRRDETRRTLGPRLAGIAAMMGTPLIPWQRYVADVACEIDEDTGTFHYNTVVISTPRQCGKSALVDSLGHVQRIPWPPPAHCLRGADRQGRRGPFQGVRRTDAGHAPDAEGP